MTTTNTQTQILGATALGASIVGSAIAFSVHMIVKFLRDDSRALISLAAQEFTRGECVCACACVC